MIIQLERSEILSKKQAIMRVITLCSEHDVEHEAPEDTWKDVMRGRYEVWSDGQAFLLGEAFRDTIDGRTVNGYCVAYLAAPLHRVHDSSEEFDAMLKSRGFEVMEYKGRKGWQRVFKGRSTWNPGPVNLHWLNGYRT